MWHVPNEKILARILRLYETEEISTEDKTIYLHFHIGACHWYIAEYDGEDTFFGFVDLGDPYQAEWGYTSYRELRDLRLVQELGDPVTGVVVCKLRLEVECDISWTPRPFSEIGKHRGEVVEVG